MDALTLPRKLPGSNRPALTGTDFPNGCATTRPLQRSISRPTTERFEQLAASGTPAVAIVGTRRASPEGLRIARELGRGLAAAGVTVISGMALGVDSAATRGGTRRRRVDKSPFSVAARMLRTRAARPRCTGGSWRKGR